MERRQADSKVLFVTAKNYEYKQVAEVYEFYIFGEADETRDRKSTRVNSSH